MTTTAPEQKSGRIYPKSKMVRGSSNAKAIVSALANLLAVLQAVAATDFLVHWNIPESLDAYSTWASAQTFAPGDNLKFNFDPALHDVVVVSYTDYVACLASDDPHYTSGNDTIPLLSEGSYYFICTFSGHCAQGMAMEVFVDPAPAPDLAPAPTMDSSSPPAPPAFDPPIESDPPLSAAAPADEPVPSPLGAHKSQAPLIGGVCAAIFGAAVVGLFAFCYLKRRKNRRNLKSSDKPTPQPNSGFPGDTNSRPYSIKELNNITKNFSSSELLSSGGFGDVYKGTPPSGAPLVAVKRIKHETEHGPATFLAEANSLRQIRHRNLLQLRGWCEAKEGMFLVYDFMSNSSLDKWLHPNPNPNQVAVFDGLSWDLRFSILAGVASALEYLHEGWVQCVLHRDIKSSNVMLDANFDAYLGDFGLARLVDHQKLQKTTMPAGTMGYMAPEMHYSGKATKETDVYAFGVLMLEVVCGRRPYKEKQDVDEFGDFLLLERVWRAYEEGNITKMVDPRLLESDNMGWSHNNVEAVHILEEWPASFADGGEGYQGNLMASVLQWGLVCCLPNPGDRPSARLVNQWFQSSKAGVMECSSLPATKPPPLAPPTRFISLPSSSEGTSSSHSSNNTVYQREMIPMSDAGRGDALHDLL